jgi:hypothetical protein
MDWEKCAAHDEEFYSLSSPKRCEVLKGCCWFALSGLVGGIIGTLASLVLTNSLFEISAQPVFTAVFGLALIFLAGALFWRMWRSQVTRKSKVVLFALACTIFCAGVLAFFLDVKWIHGLPPPTKIPMYAILSGSLAFAIVFSFSEISSLSLCAGCNETPVITGRTQLLLLFCGAITLGTICGTVFGVLDVEDEQNFDRLVRQLIITIPIGTTIGTVIGCINYVQRAWLGTARYNTVPPIPDVNL